MTKGTNFFHMSYNNMTKPNLNYLMTHFRPLTFFYFDLQRNFGNQGQLYLLKVQVNEILIQTTWSSIWWHNCRKVHISVFRSKSKLQFGTTKTRPGDCTLNGNTLVPRQMDSNSLYILGRKLKLTLTWHYVLLIFLCAYCGYFCHEILNVYVCVYFYAAF